MSDTAEQRHRLCCICCVCYVLSGSAPYSPSACTIAYTRLTDFPLRTLLPRRTAPLPPHLIAALCVMYGRPVRDTWLSHAPRDAALIAESLWMSCCCGLHVLRSLWFVVRSLSGVRMPSILFICLESVFQILIYLHNILAPRL